MISKKNLTYKGSENRLSTFDLEVPSHFNNELVVFVHGYKGYKDWGAWDIAGKKFLNEGFAFAKMNLTHNGGTVENNIDFPDLEAFGRNCYSFEVDDVVFCLKEIQKELKNSDVSVDKIHLVGHSRGGGDVILAGAKFPVDSIITWAGISSVLKRTPQMGSEQDLNWKKAGVHYVQNGRTKQQMPHYYSMMEDLIKNRAFLDIEQACKNASAKMYHIHGDSDEAISLKEAEDLSEWSGGTLHIIEGANHTFGAKHPWEENTLPTDLEKVVDMTLAFLKQ
jgi:pimeloyl-ACP methyl ester carboxylesterase